MDASDYFDDVYQLLIAKEAIKEQLRMVLDEYKRDNADLVKELAQRSLDEKWNKDLVYGQHNSRCPFCEECLSRMRKAHIYEGICEHCLCDHDICSEGGSNGIVSDIEKDTFEFLRGQIIEMFEEMVVGYI